jgi:LysM repeat protein
MNRKLFISLCALAVIGLLLAAVTPVRADGSGEPPHKYKLHRGEFPWCIARRFNVNPYELLRLNRLGAGQTYRVGQVLKIPQSGNPFPGERALHPHPDTYTVQKGDTIYSVACSYGDVEPLAIADANGLVSPYALTVGQVLEIPGDEETTADVSEPTPTPTETVAPAPVSPVETTPTSAAEAVVPTATLTPLPPTPTKTLAPAQPDTFTENRRAEYVDTLKSVTLNPAAVSKEEGQVPMGEELVGWGMGGGGEGCDVSMGTRILVPEEAEQNMDVYAIACNWPADDTPQAFVFYPDGQQVELVAVERSEEAPGPGFEFYFPTLITDPPGEYQIMVKGEKSGSSATAVFTLTEPQAPKAISVDLETVYLYAFTAGEKVTVEVYSHDADYNPVFLGTVEYAVDESGQLKIALEWIKGTYDENGYSLVITGKSSKTPASINISGPE